MNPPAATAPFLAATILLAGAGIAKTFRPSDTANALRASGFFVGNRAVRLGSLAEIGIAVAAVAAPGPATGAMVALTYGAFTTFIVVALRRGWPISSCGCFGRADTPPTVAHAVLNAGAAAAAVWWAVAWRGGGGSSRLARLFAQEPWHGGPLMLVTLVLGGLAYLVWTDPLPAARR